VTLYPLNGAQLSPTTSAEGKTTWRASTASPRFMRSTSSRTGLVHHVDNRMFGAREIGPQAPDAWNIVGRGDRDIFGASQADVSDRAHHAKRHESVGDVKRSRALGLLQQSARLDCSPRHADRRRQEQRFARHSRSAGKRTYDRSAIRGHRDQGGPPSHLGRLRLLGIREVGPALQSSRPLARAQTDFSIPPSTK
jgi:hypothetical protein